MRKKLVWTLGLLCALPLSAQQTDTIPYAHTLEIMPGDSPETIVAKAAHVVPTDNQLQALRNEFIAFFHLGPNTFSRREWGTGTEDPALFDLHRLDTDQWCEAVRQAGMKMVLLTVKHHDGFVLWQSRYTRHGIMSSPFEGGKGDILRSLAASCRKYGLKLGVYLSPADLYQIEHPEGLYGNLSRKTRRTIPRQVAGRPFENTTRFEFEVDDYNEYFLNQLFELLTEYGPIHEVWFDGAHPKRKGGQTYDYRAWRKLIRTLAPEAVIFGREDIRWCGNEAGATRRTEWNVIPYKENPELMTHFSDLTDQDLGSRQRLMEGRYLHYQQPEIDTSIRAGWFYSDDTHQQVRSADDVFDIYERSVGGNATLLLNIPPNREGVLPARDVEVLAEVGRRIRDTYGTDLLRGAEGPAALLDGDPDTGVEVEKEVEVKLPEAVTFNRIVLQEAIRTRGERVEEHAVDAWTDGAWHEVARATNIGYKRILRTADITTDRLRVRILASRLTPTLAHISLHRYASRPPQLAATRSTEGLLTLKPRPQAFDWKEHGEEVAANLGTGYVIHYTTDGSEPGEQSARYEQPFRMEGGTLRAAAFLHGERGALLEMTVGYIKQGWSATHETTSAEAHDAAAAFDERPDTYWQNRRGSAPVLTLQLPRTLSVKGFAYTPQQEHAEGMMDKGTVWVSQDGKKWQRVEQFAFGNLVNDPTQRFHYFEKPVEARYIRFEAEGTDRVCIAEIDLF